MARTKDDDVPFLPGYGNDGIFLLSAEEYNRYKDKILRIDKTWWLRSSGENGPYFTAVLPDGTVKDNYYHSGDTAFIRPAFNLTIVKREKIEADEIDIKIIDKEN